MSENIKSFPRQDETNLYIKMFYDIDDEEDGSEKSEQITPDVTEEFILIPIQKDNQLEITYCKDCKWRGKKDEYGLVFYSKNNPCPLQDSDPYLNKMADDNFYCAHGETFTCCKECIYWIKWPRSPKKHCKLTEKITAENYKCVMGIRRNENG